MQRPGDVLYLFGATCPKVNVVNEPTRARKRSDSDPRVHFGTSRRSGGVFRGFYRVLGQ